MAIFDEVTGKMQFKVVSGSYRLSHFARQKYEILVAIEDVFGKDQVKEAMRMDKAIETLTARRDVVVGSLYTLGLFGEYQDAKRKRAGV